MFGQSAMDGYNISQPDMKGTARFMSMGGAFGALGGDVSTFSQNPAGLGVYRNSDLSFTLNLDAQSSKALNSTINNTKFLLNNIGYACALRVSENTFVNLGFSFNKSASFNREYGGTFNRLQTSLSNYIAGINNSEGVTVGDVTPDKFYDPYNPVEGYVTPWISILGYDGKLVYPNDRGENNPPYWTGQWGDGVTTGSGRFYTKESGSVDEYNIALGGSFNNIVFWGMDFGITDMNFRSETDWGENLQNAFLRNPSGDGFSRQPSNWNLYNYYRVSSTGFNYKLGVIVKPIQELRIGFAFHTPTWYNIDESFYGEIGYDYPDQVPSTGYVQTNGGYTGYNSYKFHTPWRFIASVAGVISNRLILSADYEWTGYQGMKFSSNDDMGYYYDDFNSINKYDNTTNQDIKDYYRNTNTLRLGAEFRANNHISIRAGYSFVSSPVKPKAKDGRIPVYTGGTRPAFSFDNETNYITCGLGYRYKGFYADAAYVWKHRSSDFHAFAQDPDLKIMSPSCEVTSVNNQVVLTLGIKF